MKKILVPTDFSGTSLDAFRYALHWAREIGASIHVTHIYSGSFDPNEALVVSPVESRMDHVIRELDYFIHSAGEEETAAGSDLVTVTRDAHLGFASDTIVDMSEDFDYIIMGSTGNSGLIEKVFGSVSSFVSRHAHCPVLMVPKGGRYQKIENILYAADLKSINDISLTRIIDMARELGASVHFVHVAQQSEDLMPLKDQLFRELLEKKKLHQEYYITTIFDEDVLDGLKKYQESNPVQLSVIVAQRRSFWDFIVHKSLTRKLALSPKDVPCMVLHFND